MALLARAIFCAKFAEKCHARLGEREQWSGRSVEQLKGERFERN